MKRHISSHGLSVIVCTITSALLIDVVRVVIPQFYAVLSALSAWAITYFNLPFSVSGLSMLFFASLLAMIWGMAFAHLNKKY